MTDGERFLRTLHPEGLPEGMYLVIWSLPDKRSYWCSSIEGAVKTAERLVEHDDPREVFFHVGLAPRPDRKGDLAAMRPRKQDICYLPAVWADMDYNVDRAAPRVDEVPDIIVNSGHGEHWYWLLDLPAVGNEECQRLVAGWFTWLRNIGVDFDENAKDVSRVLRYPGSVNRKADPVPVEVLKWS